MSSVILKAPEGATNIPFKKKSYVVDQDGLVQNVPLFAVPELVAAGCEWTDGDHSTIKVRDELEKAESHELSQFLNAHDKHDHFWEKNVHIFSEQLRNEVGNLFIHAGPISTQLTVQKGSLEFASTTHEVLMAATIDSKLVPQGTRTGRITHSSFSDEAAEAKAKLVAQINDVIASGDPNKQRVALATELSKIPSGVRGLLTLPEGKSPDDIISGTDSDAKFVVYVDGHTLADHLDDFHGRFHADGPGRLVFLTHEQKLKLALELYDSTASKQ